MTVPPDDAEALYRRIEGAIVVFSMPPYSDDRGAAGTLLVELLARCRAVDKEVQHLRELCVDHGIDCD